MPGSASTNGPVWGTRSRDWAEPQEPVQRPFFEAALQRAGVVSGRSVLDIGCGAGLFLSMAAERGATVSGIDASAEMLTIASERLPLANLRTGDMESLPFEDASFDLVTGFNSFQFALDAVQALREARRVAKPEGRVLVLVWGKAEECEAAQVQAELRKFAPPAPGNPGPFSLSSEEKLHAVALEAGLRVDSIESVSGPFDYANIDIALRGALAGATGVRAIQAAGEQAVSEVAIRVLCRFRTSIGGVRIAFGVGPLIGRIKEFCETIPCGGAPNSQMNAAIQSTPMPDIDALREEALLAGALDPATLRFRIVEFDKYSGEMLGVPVADIGFSDAITRTAGLIETRFNSHFCLEPVGFLQ